MSDWQDDLNPASDLAPFADALQKLAPQPSHLSRDALLFAAGKAAGQSKIPVWVWPTATGTFAAISLVLTAFLVSPSETVLPETRVEMVYVPVDPHAPPQPPLPEPKPAPKAKPNPPSEEATDIARAMKMRRDVFRWGVDMLPESKSGGGGSSPDVNAREVTHWLNLPPGTFALPAHQPPKKKEENDE